MGRKKRLTTSFVLDMILPEYPSGPSSKICPAGIDGSEAQFLQGNDGGGHVAEGLQVWSFFSELG